MTITPDPIDPAGVLRFELERTRALADDMEDPESQAALADIPEIEDVRLIARNDLAADRFELNELESAGAAPQDLDAQRMIAGIAANEYRQLGGDPATVPADHVRAQVNGRESGEDYGWLAVPVGSARRVNGRWEAWAEELPDEYV